MAASILDTTRNLSFYAIPAAWVLSIAPHFYAASLGKFDNRSPRSYVNDTNSNQTVDKVTKATIARAEAAQQNGFENIGLFAAAVVAGNIGQLDNKTLNYLTGGYLVSRVVYNYVYITGTTNAKATARSVSFLAGISMIFTLFIKSGNALRDSVTGIRGL